MIAHRPAESMLCVYGLEEGGLPCCSRLTETSWFDQSVSDLGTGMSESRKAAAGPRRRRHTAKEHGPDPIDVYVGRQLRLARELAGLTQTDIGRKLGMSFQVVQKYEQGEIRVSASRLFQLSVLMDKPVAYFFEGFEVGAAAQNEM